MLSKLTRFVTLILPAVLILLAACGSQPEPAAEGAKLMVVATTNIVGDLAANVGGDLINLTVMLPTGADPHTFTPAPQDVTAVADADVVFVNGLGLEGFLGDLIDNAGGDAAVVALSEGVEPLAYAATGHDDHDDDPHDDDHEAADPHIWMSPANARVMVANIARALSELDPTNAAVYQANADAYGAELAALDEWVMAEIATIPTESRRLVTDHNTLGYYADRYGLDVVGAVLPAFSTDAEPSAQELAKLQQKIDELGVQAIFVGVTVNPVLAERMANDAGIKVISLFTGSLGEPGSGAETYLNFIRYNTTAIVEALQ